MIIDLRELDDQSSLDFDICIVGAGVAGITIAREFLNEGKKICLLESGGLEYENDTQTLYEGENIGRRYFPLTTCRLRYFGGTSNHWGGFCRPLEPIDFKKRAWLPHSGWPISKSDLDPFYRRAQPVLQLGNFEYESDFWIKEFKGENYQKIDFPSGRIVSPVFQYSPPTRFGSFYRKELEQSGDTHVYLHANVVDLYTTAYPEKVDSALVKTLDGKEFRIQAKNFVIAAGGIENARILLTSNSKHANGIGNDNDLVGRFFMEHPHVQSGSIVFSHPNTAAASFYNSRYMRHLRKKVAAGYFSVAAETREEQGILDNTMTLHPRFTVEEESEGVKAIDRMIGLIGDAQIPDRISASVKSIIADIDDISTVAYRRLFDQHPSGQEFRIGNQLEQSPNPNSRVLLDTEKDRLGINKIKLDWRLSSIDKASLIRSQEILGEELGKLGLGRLRVELPDGEEWPDNLEGGFHHMGTTRMSANANEGVVDQNCLVHGMKNLYIAGSSVFPTVGKANPTLTIVALSIRLADHLKGV